MSFRTRVEWTEISRRNLAGVEGYTPGAQRRGTRGNHGLWFIQHPQTGAL
jgi:hypothetical protein